MEVLEALNRGLDFAIYGDLDNAKAEFDQVIDLPHSFGSNTVKNDYDFYLLESIIEVHISVTQMSDTFDTEAEGQGLETLGYSFGLHI